MAVAGARLPLVGRPYIVRGQHVTPHADVREELVSHFPLGPGKRLTEVARKVSIMLGNLRIDRLHTTQPLLSPTVSGTAKAAKRNAVAYEDCLRMAIEAGEGVLGTEGLSADQVDALFLSHTTSWRSPGIAVGVCSALGMRPEVRITEVSTAACAGGGLGLVHAYEYLRAYPDKTVLVIVTEKLSTALHRKPTKDPMEKVFNGLFSDAAVAVLVSAKPRPGFVIEHADEYTVPDSFDRYTGFLADSGIRFLPDDQAPFVANKVMPIMLDKLREWGRGTPEWLGLHPGSHKIIDKMAMGLGIDPDEEGLTAESHRSLADGSNGGGGLLDAIRLKHQNPPAPGTEGFVMGLGPGIRVPYALCRWTDGR